MNKTGLLPILTSMAGLALAAMVLSSCSLGGGEEPRDLMSEEANAGASAERPVAMRGESTFVDGKLGVVATISRGFDRPGGKGNGSGAGRRRGRHDADAMSDSYPTSYGDSDEEQKEAMEDYIRQAKARRAAGSPMPPVTLRVGFENHGTAPMEIEVTDVNSDLGNFAVRPSKLTLAPGAKGALEPMISQLGVTSDEIPLTIAVRVGAKKEQQVILVKNVLHPAGAAKSS